MYQDQLLACRRSSMTTYRPMYPSTAKEKEAVRRTVLLGELNARRLLSAPCHEGNKKCGLPTNSTAVAAATSQRHLFSIASVLTILRDWSSLQGQIYQGPLPRSW